MTQYGKHLLIEAQLGAPTKITHQQCVDFMTELVHKIDMKQIGNVHVDFYNGDKDWDGPSFTVHIQTSHITCHFFEKGFLFMDVFSCKDFSTLDVTDHVYDTFDVRLLETQTVNRGSLFPEEML